MYTIKARVKAVDTWVVSTDQTEWGRLANAVAFMRSWMAGAVYPVAIAWIEDERGRVRRVADWGPQVGAVVVRAPESYDLTLIERLRRGE